MLANSMLIWHVGFDDHIHPPVWRVPIRRRLVLLSSSEMVTRNRPASSALLAGCDARLAGRARSSLDSGLVGFSLEHLRILVILLTFFLLWAAYSALARGWPCTIHFFSDRAHLFRISDIPSIGDQLHDGCAFSHLRGGRPLLSTHYHESRAPLGWLLHRGRNIPHRCNLGAPNRHCHRAGVFLR